MPKLVKITCQGHQLRKVQNTPQYYRSTEQRKIYKLTVVDGIVQLYWITVYQLTDGSFFHGRGMDVMKSLEKAEKVCELMTDSPASEADYMTALKDYFAIDKKVREQFIQKYNL